MGTFGYSPVVGNLRNLERRAKEHPKPGPPPNPEEGQLISEKFQRAHYLEFMLRWGGLWLIAMTFYFLRLIWLFCTDIFGWAGSIITALVGGFFLAYLWRLALAARRWVRIMSAMDLQNEDRRTLEARTRELDERERSLEERETDLDLREKKVQAKAVSKAAATRAAAAKKRAQQAAELAEIARDLEEDDGAGSRP